MSLSISSLNSGSNGNCYYIGNTNEGILVDAGISCREIEKRLSKLEIAMSSIKAVFISHEHSDHIRGLSVLSQKHRLPVYITTATLQNGRIALEKELVYNFNTFEPVQIGGLQVSAFSKLHDAADPHSFVIQCGQVRVGVFTDIGKPCVQLMKHFSLCHAAFLEANYDEEMLTNGSYPWHLKARIKGGNGHLSNSQALAVFTNHCPKYMSHLILSHLSKNNNCPMLVHKLFSQHAKGVQVVVADRYAATPVFHINGALKQPITIYKSMGQVQQLCFSFG